MNLDKYFETLQRCDLKTRILTASSFDFLDLLNAFEIDTNSDKFYEKQKTFIKILHDHTDNVLRNYTEWVKDGKPVDL